MKKLMIAAAVICAAVVSQAAATVWSVNTSTKYWYDGYKNTGDGYSKKAITTSPTVYFIAVASDTTGVGISQADLVSAFQSATTENPFNLASYAVPASAGAASATLSTAGRLTGSGHKIEVTNGSETSGDFTAGTQYNFYLATLITSDGKDYLYVTDAKPASAGSPTSAVTISSIDPSTSSTVFKGTGAYDGAGWYTTAVPEPTSGLLLLLGVAGLALRRRRA